MTGNFMPMYLTVNKDGLCSLWDRLEQAQNVGDEAVVVLHLTTEQMAKIVKAKGEALALSQRKQK